jgi:hypothetical protein
VAAANALQRLFLRQRGISGNVLQCDLPDVPAAALHRAQASAFAAAAAQGVAGCDLANFAITMKAMLLKTDKGLRGATPDDQEAFAKFKRKLEVMQPGKWLRLEWSSPRNGPHHRKFMALLNLVTENSETYDTIPKALWAVKLAAGYFDPHIDPRTGELTPVVHSISYDAMEQDVFDKFYSAALDGVLQTILPTMSKDTAERLIDMIVEGWA